MDKKEKMVTVGIPAYKAQKHIGDCLSSINIQSIRENVSVVIASDWPEDDYGDIQKQYPELDITVLPCEKNTGAGLARQRALDFCKTPWITFMDADDVLISPFALESLVNNITPSTVEVQGVFFQEIRDAKCINVIQRQEMLRNNQMIPPRMVPRNDVGHPWVFGRLYNAKFLKGNDIRFSSLRAMEDGEFNWKIRLLIEGSNATINVTQEPIYLWRAGSEHSITRIGTEQNDGEPLYNWDLCMVGSTAAAINAIKFCQEKNPFNGNVLRFTTEQMVNHYFTYVRCVERKKMFAEQCLFNAKRFYHSVFKNIEGQISKNVLKQIYTAQYAHSGDDMVNVIPSITFWDFLDKMKADTYGGKQEFDEIRSKLPSWVVDLDKESGVLGEEGYVYTTGENDTNH